MERTFRLKLFSILAVAALGLLVITIVDGVVESRVERHLSTIREQYIPKIGLAEHLQSSFERVSRGLQDAAQANDLEGLAEANRHKVVLLEQLVAAHDAVDPRQASALRAAIEEYFATAEPVTRKMIRGDSVESMVGEVERMQTMQKQVHRLIGEAAAFDEKGLGAAFLAATEAQDEGAQLRLLTSLACLTLVLGLSIWITRGLYASLADLADGFHRFGEGDFLTPIPAKRNDELGAVARDANQMADRLRRLAAERERSVWITAGQVGLADELRGELAPDQVGDRALAFLARYVGVPLGAIYYADPDEVLRFLGGHGVPDERRASLASFAPGDGLVGEAVRSPDITIIRAPAGRLPIRSGLVEGDPHSLVLVPLLHGGKVRGIVELAIVAEWEAKHDELMLTVRDSLAIAIEVARARSAMRALLDETQRQATELLTARQGLEQKARELARASTYKSQFLANMSHELRTPLNAILGFSELLHDGAVPADDPQHREFLGDIITSGRHLLQLINDILDLSKVEAGKLELQAEPISIATTVGEVVAILRTTSASARVKIVTRLDPAIDAVVLDPARLKQVLYNYLSNAIKFSPVGGIVTLAVRPEGPDFLRIEVIDTGIGIAADDLVRLFGEFQQVAGDGKNRGGTGLGLALTKRLVEAQGGTVGVHSIVGEGSTFHAILPRSWHGATAALTLAAPNDGPSVLIVEDDARDRADLVDALGGAGYAIEAVSSGAHALERCKARTFDAITLDLLLPDMSGLELLRQIRTHTKHETVPVIVITVVAERGAVAGFAVNDILPKPLEAELLVAALDRAGVQTGRGSVMVVDDDPGALKLMAGMLRQLGYEPRCEADGESALRALRATPPAAVVLDLLMPGMSGFEFLDELRRDTSGRRIPVLVWTSKDLSLDETARLRASANAVVTKGENRSAVIAELAALLPGRS